MSSALTVKKEVAERWKRGAEGAETNAEGVRIKAPRGSGLGRGCPPLQPTIGGLGERRELVRGGAPAENEFGAFCGRYRRTLIAT